MENRYKPHEVLIGEDSIEEDEVDDEETDAIEERSFFDLIERKE